MMNGLHLIDTAGEIAAMRGAIRRGDDYNALRGYCDMLTCGGLDPVQLDILTSMVGRRIRSGITQDTVPVMGIALVDLPTSQHRHN